MRENLNIYRGRAIKEKPSRGRFVLINVEEHLNKNAEKDEPQYRAWAHLGCSTIAAVAEESGFDVVFHDENLEGFSDLKKLITPGCIVGLSLVVTGMERGMEIAREAKQLGASHVILGNDGAIFRAKQILEMPENPVDAIFTGSGLRPVREFLDSVRTGKMEDLDIPGVQITPPVENRSNSLGAVLKEKELRRAGKYKPDFFRVPKFNERHLEFAAENYHKAFYKQHPNGVEKVRPALALFAQGCTRTGDGHICRYCTIADVGVISLAEKAYLKKLLDSYKEQGINYVFNVTDSSYGMEHVLDQLEELGAHFSEGLVLYARAHEICQKPHLIKRWQALTGNGRVVFNMGLDSGSERLLQNVDKASRPGSRLSENWQALRYIKEAGAFAHFSAMWGIPGEDEVTAKATWDFMKSAVEYMGGQVSQAECDKFWLNFGSPAAEVFTDYAVAIEYAALAGKTISREEWERDFYAYRDALSVPHSALEAWYRHFTQISLQEAEAYVDRWNEYMAPHPTAAPGRSFNFAPRYESKTSA